MPSAAPISEQGSTLMSRDTLLPHGEALRRAVQWLGQARQHDAASVAEAARRFDLTPLEEQFLLEHFARQVSAAGNNRSQPD